MTTINPFNVRTLREQKHMTLDELAIIAQIDRGTISKIENGRRDATRPSTLRKLAIALGVDADVLTGPNIDEADRTPLLARKTQMNFKMASDARNALSLVALRYNVKPGQILHLAPFLFYWAAEESLKWRTERLNEINEKIDAVSAVSHPSHLSSLATTNWRGEEILENESRSIAKRDLFGLLIDDENVCSGYEESEQNPIAQFFKSIAATLNGHVEFEYWSPHWSHAGYTLGKEEALELVGGDQDAAHHILCGYAPLHELPKDTREQGSLAIAKWANEIGDATLADHLDSSLNALEIGGDHE